MSSVQDIDQLGVGVTQVAADIAAGSENPNRQLQSPHRVASRISVSRSRGKKRAALEPSRSRKEVNVSTAEALSSQEAKSAERLVRGTAASSKETFLCSQIQTNGTKIEVVGLAIKEEFEVEAVPEATPKKSSKRKGPLKTEAEPPGASQEAAEDDELAEKPKRRRKTKEEREAEAMPLAARTSGLRMYVGAHVSSAKGGSLIGVSVHDRQAEMCCPGVHNSVTNCVHIGWLFPYELQRSNLMMISEEMRLLCS